MKKKFLIASFFATLVVATIFITSCKKDEFTEEDAINLQAQIDRTRDSLLAVGGVIVYTVNVMDAGAAGFTSGRIASECILSGATVTATQGSSVSTGTTNSSGQVVFSDMRIGNVSVVVSMAGYATVSYIADLTPAEEGTIQSVRNAATQVPMFPTTGNNTATISGIVSYESNLTNLTREYPQGANVVAAIDVNNPTFHAMYIDPTGGASTQNTNQAGRIIKMAFANASTTGTVDANGNYSITIPATASGLPIKLELSQVVTNQSIILATVNGEDVYGTQSIRTVFDINSGAAYSDVPTVDNINLFAAYVTIGAPTGVTGKPKTQATASATIVGGEIDDINIGFKGEGYVVAPYVIISGDGYGATATATINAAGEVSNIAINDDGEDYTWATITLLNFDETHPAKVTPTINDNGNITGFTVVDGGKGYIDVPSFTITPSVSGFGTGCEAVVEISQTTGTVSNVRLVRGGSGYLAKNYPAKTLPSITGGSNTFNIYSGANQVRDIYLGTGVRQILN